MAFVGLLGVAVVRAVYLGAIQAGSLQRAAATQQVTTEVVPAPRGTITDRNGVELAISESADDIVADPYLIKNAPVTAQRLATLLGQPVATVQAELTKPDTGFVYLAHELPADQAKQIRTCGSTGSASFPR